MATVTGTRRLLDISGNNISTEVSLEASGTLLDVNGQSGTSGQILSSTGSAIDWIDTSTIVQIPAILSNGTVPSLNTGITATEVNTLLGTMSGFGVSNLPSGTGTTFTITNGQTLGIVGGTDIQAVVNTTNETITLNYTGSAGDVTAVQADTTDEYKGIEVTDSAGPIPLIGLDINGSTALASTANNADELMIYDNSNAENKKITVANLMAAAPQGDITQIIPGTGMTGTSLTGPIPTLNVIGGAGLTANADDMAVDYLGTDSIIKAAPTASGAVAIGDFLLVANSSGNVFETTMSNLPFVTTTGNQSIAGVKSFSGKIGADGGIDGLTLANGGINGANYDIRGVNQLIISDPGEGIVFTGTATMYLNAVDDATDSILKLTNATQLNLNSTARITNLVNPTGTQDAATKNYVDTEIGNIPSGLAFEGNWNASTDTPTLAGTTQDNGKFWIVSVAGSTNLSGITDWAVGDWAIYVDNGAGTDAWQKVDNSSSLAGAGSAGKVTFWSSTSNVSFNNNFTYDGTYLTAPRMRVGDGTDGYFWSDTAGRTAFAAGDFYIQNTVANYYNYATRIYLGDNTGDNVLFRGSTITGTSWGITPAGAATFTTVTGTTVVGGVSTSNVDGQGNIPFKLSIDYNSYMVAAAGSTWGLFWAGNSGARYGTNGNGGPGNIWGNSGNPNEFVFVGGDNTRWTVNGNTGDTWQNGDLYVGGGDIILSGTGRIQGVDTVSAGTDAANKTYVDTKLSLTGGAMTGAISMGTQIFATASNYGRGVFGLYSPTKYQHVWSMGNAYKLADAGTSTGTGGNLYGLAWSYNPNYGAAGNNAQAKAGLNHQLLLMQNGTTTFAAGSGMWTSGTITANNGQIVLNGTGRIQGVDTVSAST